MLAGTRSILVALALALLAGCASRDCCPGATCCPVVAPQVLACRPVERTALRPDVLAVAPQDIAPRVVDPHFCALEEREAQCLAAKNATTANLIDGEAQAAAAQPHGLLGHKAGSELTSEVLRLEAIYRRNAAAADALEVFLRLIEAEGGTDNLQRRGQEMNLVLADIDRLQSHGLLSPVSKPESEGQRLDIWHRQVETAATVETLNFRLKNLLGVEIAVNARFWPQASLAVTTDIPDRQAAVRVALANRADLAAVRLVACSGSDESTAAAKTILQLSGSGLGTTPSPACLGLLLHHAAAEDERAARTRQISELLADRERAARDETLQAVMILEARIGQIAVTRRRLDVAQAHQQASEQQQQLTAGAPLSVRKARLDVLAAEQDLLHDVIEWKLAVVKLKEAQGLLAVECGYDGASRVLSRTASCQ